MNARCDCGTRIDHPFHRLACLDCGVTCCPVCAIAVESVTYCRHCAEALLGSGVSPHGSFDLY
jgi:hypothetical protein